MRALWLAPKGGGKGRRERRQCQACADGAAARGVGERGRADARAPSGGAGQRSIMALCNMAVPLRPMMRRVATGVSPRGVGTVSIPVLGELAGSSENLLPPVQPTRGSLSSRDPPSWPRMPQRPAEPGASPGSAAAPPCDAVAAGDPCRRHGVPWTRRARIDLGRHADHALQPPRPA